VASIFIAGVHVLDRGGSFTGPVDVSVLDGRITGASPGLRPPRPGSTHIVACHFGADPLAAG
jgi:hypothetical protein